MIAALSAGLLDLLLLTFHSWFHSSILRGRYSGAGVVSVAVAVLLDFIFVVSREQ